MRSSTLHVAVLTIVAACAGAPVASAHEGHSRGVYVAPMATPLYHTIGPLDLGCAPDLYVNPRHCGTDDGDRVRIVVADAVVQSVRFDWFLYCHVGGSVVRCDSGTAQGEADFATPPNSAFVSVFLDYPYTAGNVDFRWYHST